MRLLGERAPNRGPGEPRLASGKWGSARRVSGAEGSQLLAWFQSCGPSRSPGPTQGESREGDKQQIQGAARSPPPPGLAPSPRAQGPGRGCGVSLDRGSEGPRALVLSDPSSANAALVASLTRSPGSVCRHKSATFLPLGPAISRIQGEKCAAVRYGSVQRRELVKQGGARGLQADTFVPSGSAQLYCSRGWSKGLFLSPRVSSEINSL